MAQQEYSISFSLPNGQPLAFGSLTVQLNTDAVVTTTNGPQVIAGRIVRVNLDNTGSVTFPIWPNSQMQPANTVYFLNAYSAQGQLAWSGQISL